MSLLIRDHIKLASNSLRRNRTRTFLTALGIAIGVAAIVLIFAFTGNINNLINGQVEQSGSNLIVVRPTNEIKSNNPNTLIEDFATSDKYTKSNLTLDDVKALKTIKNVDKIAPISITKTNVEVANQPSNTVSVVATTMDINQIVNLPIQTGQFFDETHQPNSAVIGYAAAQELYGTENAVAKTFVYNGQRFIIVGVLEERNDYINYNNVNFDSSILVNISLRRQGPLRRSGLQDHDRPLRGQAHLPARVLRYPEGRFLRDQRLQGQERAHRPSAADALQPASRRGRLLRRRHRCRRGPEGHRHR